MPSAITSAPANVAVAPHAAPDATHTRCGRPAAPAAHVTAAWTVKNGVALLLPIAVASLPVGETLTHVAQFSSTAPSQSSSMPSHVVSLAASAAFGVHVPVTPDA